MSDPLEKVIRPYRRRPNIGADMQYRKKTTIEATQWFCNGQCPTWGQSAVRECGGHFEIDTREGTLKGVPGDWIARGVEGEVYPIGADIFFKTYEPSISGHG
jgi:hypothetical protein